MFVGHYSASFVAKAAAPRVPAWGLLLAAQFVDVLWAGFVLVGIERVRLDPSLPSNPLDLEYMPFTHSLLATVVWAALVFVVVRARSTLGGDGRAAAVTAGVVCSHWLLDVLVHRADMTVWGGDTRFGLGLWNYPLPAYLLELAVVFGSASWLVRRQRCTGRRRTAVFGFAGGLAVLQTAVSFGPLPGSPVEMVVSALAGFLLIAWAGGRTEAWARATA